MRMIGTRIKRMQQIRADFRNSDFLRVIYFVNSFRHLAVSFSEVGKPSADAKGDFILLKKALTE